MTDDKPKRRPDDALEGDWHAIIGDDGELDYVRDGDEKPKRKNDELAGEDGVESLLESMFLTSLERHLHDPRIIALGVAVAILLAFYIGGVNRVALTSPTPVQPTATFRPASTPGAAAVVTIPETFIGLNDWVATFAPIAAIGFGISIALYVLGYLANLFVQAMRGKDK